MLLVFTYNYRTRYTHTHELLQQPEFANLQRLLARLHWKEWLLGWRRSLFSGVGQGGVPPLRLEGFP
jgi:hypothetical protein